jgi:hypothetical protein
MFTRLHHQAIAQVLHALDGDLLREHACLFGGGTAIAMRFGEFRESVDDAVCGIASLSSLDMATSKLLANSDRWNDDGAFNRDLIDLAMMHPDRDLLKAAVSKARGAYGGAIEVDLGKAIDRVKNRNGWLERCMEAMAMDLPKAVMWKHIRELKKAL